MLSSPRPPDGTVAEKVGAALGVGAGAVVGVAADVQVGSCVGILADVKADIGVHIAALGAFPAEANFCG